MLTALSNPNKNTTPEKQMAMMRNYINQLKDETETELYDIKWDNLSKTLKDKIDALDRDIVAANDNVDYLRANVITAEQISAEYVKASALYTQVGNVRTLLSNYVYAGSITASQINAGTISTERLDVDAITAGCVLANDLYITGNVVARGHLSATEISAKFSTNESAVFNRINVALASNTETNLRFLLPDNTYAAVKLATTSTPQRYSLVVDLPS